MLDLLVFTQHPKAYAPQRFLEEAKLYGLSCMLYGYEQIVDVNKLPKSKAIILREPDHDKNLYKLRDQILQHYLPYSTLLNAKSYLKWSILDKIIQHQEFTKANISHIPLLNLSDAKYPFIAKNKLGSHGDSVYKIEGPEDLEKVLLKHKKQDLLFQKFQTSGFDLRVIVLGGRVLGIMKRTPREGEFLSNFSQGGFVEMYKGDDIDEIKNIALKTAKHFKLEYVGVDLMKGNLPAGRQVMSEWKVLEVNRACQFKGFEKATGVNVAREVILTLQGETLQL